MRLQRRLPLHLEAPADLGPEAQQRLRRLSVALTLARAQYAPKATIDSELLLLKAAVPEAWPGCQTDEVYGWGAFIRGHLITAQVPGTHHALFARENDVFIAQAVSARLDALAAATRFVE